MAGMDAAELASRLESFLAARLGGPVSVRGLERLPGGASRQTWSFTAATVDGERRLVLRRDPPGAGQSSMDRATEFGLLRAAAAAGVPVPSALWCDDEAFGSPGFLMEHVDGETIARRILRDDTYAAARPAMAAQCGEILARIHTMDPGPVAPGADPAREALARYRTLLDSFGEPHPAFELGLRWLERHAPAPGRVTLVHGDFRTGNLVVGPDGVRAVLDWELAHPGDPLEDLGWLCVRSWRFGGPGEVGGFGDRGDLFAAYERASGVTVDPGAVRWWEVFGNLKWGVICVAQSFTHLWGHVRSVELAAIGRRACETEHDLLELIG